MSDLQPDREPDAADDELVMRAKRDRAALGVLYDGYYPLVARYCLRRLLDRAAAEDVTSEVFLQVASHIGRFAGRTTSDFRRWLFRIATNSVNAQLRQSRRRRELWTAAAHRGEWANERGSAADHELLDWPVICQAVLELGERDQSIVALRFFADCSYEEIGSIVQATPGAVRTSLSRSLARLRERFGPPRPTQPEAGTTDAK